MPGIKGGKPKQYAQAMELVTQGVGRAKMAMLTNLSERDCVWLANRASMKPDEFQEQVKAEIELTQGKLLKRAESQIDKMSGAQALVGYGILDDKKHNINQVIRPTTQINVQINGESKSKDDVLKGLFGNAVDVESVSGDTDANLKHINKSEYVDTSSPKDRV